MGVGVGHRVLVLALLCSALVGHPPRRLRLRRRRAVKHHGRARRLNRFPALPARRTRCPLRPVALPPLRCAVSGVGLDVARLLGRPRLVAFFSLLAHLHGVS